MHLRAAVVSDAVAIAALHRAALWDALPHLRRVHSDTETAAFFATEIEGPKRVQVAVDEREEILGFAVVAESWLEQLYVAPLAQHNGVGTALLNWTLDVSFGRMQVWTFQANTLARAFYERAGFTVAELTDGHRNEELEPDVRYVRTRRAPDGGSG